MIGCSSTRLLRSGLISVRREAERRPLRMDTNNNTFIKLPPPPSTPGASPESAMEIDERTEGGKEEEHGGLPPPWRGEEQDGDRSASR